jgi:hypothetical protein
MSTFSFTIGHKVQLIDENLFEVIQINILMVTGKFIISSRQPFVRVFDSSNKVTNFSIQISGNEKELIAYFTTDAFDFFTGDVTIEFGEGLLVTDTFENIDIISVITPLSPADAALGAPQADNAWLASQI